jgi:hypothetical protein
MAIKVCQKIDGFRLGWIKFKDHRILNLNRTLLSLSLTGTFIIIKSVGIEICDSRAW